MTRRGQERREDRERQDVSKRIEGTFHRLQRKRKNRMDVHDMAKPVGYFGTVSMA